MLNCQRVYHVFLKTGIQYFEPQKHKESVQRAGYALIERPTGLSVSLARTSPIIRFYHHQAVCTYVFVVMHSRYILSSIWNLI